MAERDFAEKLERAGFVGIDVVERRAFGVNECTMYPLFTEDLIDLMRDLLPPEQQDSVAVSIVLKAELADR